MKELEQLFKMLEQKDQLIKDYQDMVFRYRTLCEDQQNDIENLRAKLLTVTSKGKKWTVN